MHLHGGEKCSRIAEEHKGGRLYGSLYALESIRTPALDKIMSVITLLGGELFFMVIAVTVFWCVSKREGYYLMIVGFFGTVINHS